MEKYQKQTTLKDMRKIRDDLYKKVKGQKQQAIMNDTVLDPADIQRQAEDAIKNIDENIIKGDGKDPFRRGINRPT